MFRKNRRQSTKVWQCPGGTAHNLYLDALDQPHMLIAGATGSGKSVAVNGMIYTALFRAPCDTPNGAQFILIDPKRVELSMYRVLPHTLYYASEPDTMLYALHYAMEICERRYRQMQSAGIRKYMGSDVYIIIDEFADLMTTQKRQIMPVVQRLAQIGRAARMHIILATQTPIAKVLPTEIKCNFDARLALRTRSAQDSRNITGFNGCECLPRYGKAYYITPECNGIASVPMIPEAEIRSRIFWWTQQTGNTKVKKVF